MNSRNKRARLELSVAPTNIDAGIVNGCPVNTNTQLTSSIGGTQSIFLGNAINTNTNSTDALSMLPTNVFLTICDENSDESQDYLAIGSTFAHTIKQEHEEALCIGGSNVSSSSSSSTQSTQTLPLQYRVVNQTQRQLPTLENMNSNCTINGGNNATPTLNATLPMQLSNGCEIYIVKEYIDNMPTILTDGELLQGPPSPHVTRSTTTAIKLEPDSCLTPTAVTSAATTTANTAVNGVQILRNTTLPCVITTSKLPNASANDGRINANKNGLTVTTINGVAGELQHNGTKRSCILEAYKKRDDKRRATHNEVERRRRDKINNWIFKLKEMLPTDSANNNNNNNNNQHNSLVGDNGTAKSNSTNGSNYTNNNSSNRTPPSDSKSQILIKACEYIKTMQDEMKGLRECLSENENLRLSNQRLQNELTKLQNERAAAAATASATLHTRNFNSNFNITLNSLNSNNSNGSGGSASSSPGGTGSIFSSLNIIPHMSTNTYTKRELIIRDYVD